MITYPEYYIVYLHQYDGNEGCLWIIPYINSMQDQFPPTVNPCTSFRVILLTYK